jgi:hypothetical protein
LAAGSDLDPENGVQEVAGSNPVAPTVFRKKPFGENVEGLSYFRRESCAPRIVFN